MTPCGRSFAKTSRRCRSTSWCFWTSAPSLLAKRLGLLLELAPFVWLAHRRLSLVRARAVPKGANRSVVGAFSLPGAANPNGLWALWQRVGAWNAALFTLFVEEELLPRLPEGRVLVLDNASIHHSISLQEAVEKAGSQLLFLPPYSPDFNPIELLWGWLKDQVRALAPRDDQQRRESIFSVSATRPPQHAWAWFHKCGLC